MEHGDVLLQIPVLHDPIVLLKIERVVLLSTLVRHNR